MTRWTRRLTTLAAPLLFRSLLLPEPGVALQRASAATSIVIVTGQDAPMPIPTLMEGPQANLANYEVADQLFLRLAGLGPTLQTAGDQALVPRLARRWVRRDSLTLAFELDPRARWHDGAPVTARDVVFTLRRARDPAIAPKVSRVLQSIASVEAEGERTVVFRFNRVYAEQVYDATYHVAPLPAHLLAHLPADAVGRSDFVNHPVGSGPYRWVRRVPGDLIELAANERFFLGRPGITRVLIRVAADADARLNLVLSGEADAMDNIPPPLSNLQRVARQGDLRLVQVPSPTVGYLLYNQRDRKDHSRSHPILADTAVRRALTLALDRRMLAQAVFGRNAEVPYGPVSPLLWIRHGAPAPLAVNREEARRLLAASGWKDADGDGVLDRNGESLSLSVSYPNTSGIRRQMAQLIQEQWRAVGVRAELAQLEGPVWNERRAAGDFDVDLSAATQDPSPATITQSWTCARGGNVAGYCDPVFDSLVAAALAGQGETGPIWHAALGRLESSAPATFLYAPVYVYAVNRRFQNVVIRPESSWIALWRWSVRPDHARAAGGTR